MFVTFRSGVYDLVVNLLIPLYLNVDVFDEEEDTTLALVLRLA
jgi:hypothetical protein